MDEDLNQRWKEIERRWRIVDRVVITVLCVLIILSAVGVV